MQPMSPNPPRFQIPTRRSITLRGWVWIIATIGCVAVWYGVLWLVAVWLRTL